MSSQVGDYFAGKTVMLTGGTGFIGKVLVEKLLRCCPDVDKIYLLIRPKAGQDPVDRIRKEFSDCKVSAKYIFWDYFISFVDLSLDLKAFTLPSLSVFY